MIYFKFLIFGILLVNIANAISPGKLFERKPAPPYQHLWRPYHAFTQVVYIRNFRTEAGGIPPPLPKAVKPDDWKKLYEHSSFPGNS